jgi:hypothetical protein
VKNILCATFQESKSHDALHETENAYVQQHLDWRMLTHLITLETAVQGLLACLAPPSLLL